MNLFHGVLRTIVMLLISRKAINQIKNMTINFYDEPYEDLLIAKLLNKKKIYPKNIINLHTYIYSKNHQ